jgi:multidrug efflux pump subunit AcrB
VALEKAMRFRWAVVLVCVLVVASIVPLYKYVGMSFLPDEDESLYQVNVRWPAGNIAFGDAVYSGPDLPRRSGRNSGR